MKKIVFLIIFLACAGVTANYIIKSLARTNLAINSKVAAVSDRLEKIRAGIFQSAKDFQKDFQKDLKPARDALMKKPAPPEPPPQQMISLRLKHGGTVSGKLISKDKDQYVVEWKGGEVVLQASQIERVEFKSELEIAWPYKNDVVIKKMNGIVVDGKIAGVDKDNINVLFEEGGGSMEMGVNLKDVNYLMFAPVYNAESRKIEANLKTLFPKMQFYQEGNFTLVTDSYITWVNIYKKTLRATYTDIYLKFFNLFNGRKPLNQNFVVIFDNPVDFAEYAIADCVPFWLVLGYFDPTQKVLYLYNAFGDKMEKAAFGVVARELGKYDEWVKSVKQKYGIDNRYDLFIDGQTKEVKDRLWNAYNFYKGRLTGETLSTLRHEFTHEVFHNWGLQNIVLSKPKIAKDDLIKKKKEFLDTDDPVKKKELFMTLMKMAKEESKDIEMEASQSWLNEGLAAYFATDPPGSIDEDWLFLFQEMERKKEVNPIEFITNFRMGSFPGLVHRAKLNAYAESWAFTAFLVSRYPAQFADYQKRLAWQAVQKDDDRLTWLLESLHKDLPALEKEFSDYMKAYPKIEDPDVKLFMKYHEIFRN